MMDTKPQTCRSRGHVVGLVYVHLEAAALVADVVESCVPCAVLPAILGLGVGAVPLALTVPRVTGGAAGLP